MIWLLSQGKPSHDVAQVLGLSLRWVRVLARRYNAGGPASLGDGRHSNPGPTSRLTAEMEAALSQALESPAPDEVGGGLWSGPKVVRYLGQALGCSLSVRRAQQVMARLGYSAVKRECRVPRPQHAKADALAQDEFKKS